MESVSRSVARRGVGFVWSVAVFSFEEVDRSADEKLCMRWTRGIGRCPENDVMLNQACPRET